MRNILGDRPSLDVHGLAGHVRSIVQSEVDAADVLDIGCGFGWFELMVMENGARSVMAVEPDEESLAPIRAAIDDPRLSTKAASAIDLPFEDGSFDVVAMWEVLEHLPVGTEPDAFREIARVLRSDGRLFLSTPHDSFAAKVTDPAWWLQGHRHYSTARVRDFAVAAGLEVEAITVRGGWRQIVFMLNLYVAKWVFRRRPFFERRSVERLDQEWARPTGFAHVFLRATKQGHP